MFGSDLETRKQDNEQKRQAVTEDYVNRTLEADYDENEVITFGTLRRAIKAAFDAGYNAGSGAALTSVFDVLLKKDMPQIDESKLS